MKDLQKVNNLCSGCTACKYVCPQNCIEIQTNTEGFYQAFLNPNKCIECGICHRVCPMEKEIKKTIMSCFAAASEDVEVYCRSSSGGIFSLVAEEIIIEGGSVYGCAMDSNLVPHHKKISRKNQIEELRRSKYVQSDLRDCFSQIKKQLNEQEKILFVGTPCQVSGLYLYLGKKEYQNLYTIDIICHGTPSPQMFISNLKWIEKEHKKKLKEYEFRLKTKKSKETGKYCYRYVFEDDTIEDGVYYRDPFFNEFYDMTNLNECCYSCPYATENRPGDLTIGDYEWGKSHHAEFIKFDEISCVLVNSNKGKAIFEKIKNIRRTETKLCYIEEKNANLLHPTNRPKYRTYIFEDISKLGYEQWAKAYFKSIRYFKKLRIFQPIIKIKIYLNKYVKEKRR